ncbi:ribosomal protein L18e/L15P [Pelagophyceae sp. CCMP2097]|nr:ribosomal protein L18e/L15P [Pelagophyceae sp. CCMP2097]
MKFAVAVLAWAVGVTSLVVKTGPVRAGVARTSTRSVSMKLYDWKRREADESGIAHVNAMEFRADNIRAAPGAKHRKSRKGRGISAGQGATCGFGMRGQNSRAGRPTRAGFEGGQMPLYRRLPKLVGSPMGPGHTVETFSLIKLPALAGLAEGSDVDFESLLVTGAVTKTGKKSVYKVVGGRAGEEIVVPKGLKIKAHAFTAAAKQQIEAAGGSCIVISKTTQEILDLVEA